MTVALIAILVGVRVCEIEVVGDKVMVALGVCINTEDIDGVGIDSPVLEQDVNAKNIKRNIGKLLRKLII